MTKEFFEEVMRIPSCSSHEDMMQEYILDWASKHGCQTKKDGKGNIYLTKGSAKIYPAMVNHMDTVHHDQLDLIESKQYKTIEWKGTTATAIHPVTGKQTGLGMDNQGGCCIALAVIDRLPAAKALFTVEEEIGMRGVNAADLTFFSDAAFVMSNDSPERNRATHYSSGVELYGKDFFEKYLEPICKKHGVTKFNSEPYTCIKIVRSKLEDSEGKHIECFNFGNGGLAPHQSREYADLKDVTAAEDLLYAICTEIPLDKQYSSPITPEARPDYTSLMSKYMQSQNKSKGSSIYQPDLFSGEDPEDEEEITFEDRDPTDICSVIVDFDDEDMYRKFKKLVSDEGVSVEIDDLDNHDQAEIFGQLQNVQKAYILWYQLFYHDPSVKTWEDLEHEGATLDFEIAVTFEDPDPLSNEFDNMSFDSDNTYSDTSYLDDDSDDAFWDFIDRRKRGEA